MSLAPCFSQLLTHYSNDPVLTDIALELNACKSYSEALMRCYDTAIPILETYLAKAQFAPQLLADYQRMFQEREQILDKLAVQSGKDKYRHDIVVAIPVADRPAHLQSCLDSLLTLIAVFLGEKNRRVSVLIIDDSKDDEAIKVHQQLASTFTKKGLIVNYFGAIAQQEEIKQLTTLSKAVKARIIGDIPTTQFYHKGASLSRNISYLYLRRIQHTKHNPLFFFIDSDQEFRVPVMTSTGEKYCYGINYFYYLDRLFTERDIIFCTGKVVGDPPVSPAVMAGNLLDDVYFFLQQIQHTDSQAACQFHTHHHLHNDAAYHDMADLFGFKKTSPTYPYACPIDGSHTHTDCLQTFVDNLMHFFDGEHPTRKSVYQYVDILENYQTARTVYTGNYVFTPRGLEYFIPFATLKLRMAGPVLGRIIKALCGQRFISANLPLLHKRTLTHLGRAEFRVGIDKCQHHIDMSGEFERQFWGDVMLFSVEQLLQDGYIKNNISLEEIAQTVQTTQQRLYKKYIAKQQEIKDKHQQIQKFFEQHSYWWQQQKLLPIRTQFDHFLANIEYNFNEQAPVYQLLCSQEYVAIQQEKIVQALFAYPGDHHAWTKFISA